MNDETTPVLERREVIEERANRDAFRICLLLLLVVAMGLGLLGIVAMRTRFLVMPLVPMPENVMPAPPRKMKAFTPRVPGTNTIQTSSRPPSARGVDSLSAVNCGPRSQTCRPAADGTDGSVLVPVEHPAAGLQQTSSSHEGRNPRAPKVSAWSTCELRCGSEPQQLFGAGLRCPTPGSPTQHDSSNRGVAAGAGRPAGATLFAAT